MFRRLSLCFAALAILGLARPSTAQAPEKKIKLIEYGDFQCPYCQKAFGTLMQILDTYGDKIDWEWKHFPLEFHPHAKPAALISECSRDQGKFVEVHNAFFALNNRDMNEGTLLNAAKGVVADPAALEKCYRSGEKQGIVDRDQAEGQALGITGTPAFLVNGKIISGAMPFEVFQRAIDVVLDPSKGTQMYVITPPGCKKKCAPESLLKEIMGDVFVGVVRQDVPLDSAKGQELKKLFGLTGVPALILDKSVEQEPRFNDVSRRLTRMQDYYLVSTQIVPPTLYLQPLPGYTFDLSLGPKQAPVTVVEYTDFKSDKAAQVSHAMIEVIKRYPGKIRHIVRPVPSSGKTTPDNVLGRAAYCLGEQGKFWKSYSYIPLMGNDASGPEISQMAGLSGANRGAFDSCLKQENRFGARESAYVKDANTLSLRPGVNLFVGRQRLEDPGLFKIMEAVQSTLKATKGAGH